MRPLLIGLALLCLVGSVASFLSSHPIPGAIFLVASLAGFPRPPARPTAQDARKPDAKTRANLGDYRLVRLLGKGTAAEVYLGEKADGTQAAIKLLFQDTTETNEFRVRFEREASLCAKLDHPRLVKTYAWSVSEKRYWMAQTYLPGGTLRTWIKSSGMQPQTAKKVLIQIAEGLEHAHGKGVIHRDIKPENILLNSKGEPVIADFGIARRENLQTISQKNDIIGSPAFISPEQIEGVALDGRSDLYSLGVIGYELLTGSLPFRGKTMSVLMDHLRKPPPPPRLLNPTIPAAYEAVILKLLEKNPADRYQTARELITALNQI